MKINTLKINDFRIFKDITITLGNHITVLAGSNAVGKSTILGLLGNSCELKKSDGVPILQPSFRCEWSELFKMSPNFDKTKSNVAIINFDDNTSMSYRITWQENGTRGRLIPTTKNEDGSDSNAKKPWPSLYLGLSRLYPLGEALFAEKDSKTIQISDDLIKTYTDILSLSDSISTTNQISLSDVKKKITVGVNTDKYDYLTNSAGQDNLAQILLSVESFKRLSNENSETYSGGLLLIDEIDAALHPSAQNKLFHYLYESAKSLNLQIVFTTHSISLLDYIVSISEGMNKCKDECKPIEIYYFSRANCEESPTIIRTPNKNLYTNLLLETVTFRRQQKIKIITEDAEARWLLSKLIPEELKSRINILDTQIGYNEILSLTKCDSSYFKSRIIILDGDITSKTAVMRDINNLNSIGLNILYLPGQASIEASFRKFLLSESPHVNNYFNNNICLSNGLTKMHFKQENLNSYYNRGKQRDKLKAWFNSYRSLFEETQLYEAWSHEYEDDINTFLEQLKASINKIASLLYIP